MNNLFDEKYKQHVLYEPIHVLLTWMAVFFIFTIYKSGHLSGDGLYAAVDTYSKSTVYTWDKLGVTGILLTIPITCIFLLSAKATPEKSWKSSKLILLNHFSVSTISLLLKTTYSVGSGIIGTMLAFMFISASNPETNDYIAAGALFGTFTLILAGTWSFKHFMTTEHLTYLYRRVANFPSQFFAYAALTFTMLLLIYFGYPILTWYFTKDISTS